MKPRVSLSTAIWATALIAICTAWMTDRLRLIEQHEIAIEIMRRELAHVSAMASGYESEVNALVKALRDLHRQRRQENRPELK